MSKKSIKNRKYPEGSTTVYTIKFNFPITDAEAKAFVHKPNGDVSKQLKKYLFDTLEYVCKKVLADKENKEKEIE